MSIIILTTLSFIFSTPAFIMLIISIASLNRREQQKYSTFSDLTPTLAVIVPAHNESIFLTPTIESISKQLKPSDRLVVVADNCTDDTAKVARSFCIEVLERHDSNRRGKGYALAFGVDHLRKRPPNVVVIIDADCLLSENALPTLAAECHRTGYPVQILNLMTTEGMHSDLRFRVMEFAMLMKNKVRPLGSYNLGRACHLMGTGMALPWQLIENSNLATGHIAEDMKLGIELTLKGKAPRFLPSVNVTSRFAENSSVAKAQKSRWEHGHMAVMAEELPQLLWQAIRKRQAALIVLAMDLMIPPIALYFMLLSSLLLLSSLGAWFFHPLKPMAWVAASGFCTLSLSILIGWWFFGRHLLSVRELLTTPLYALWKLPVYVAFFMKKRSGWKRTDRDKK